MKKQNKKQNFINTSKVKKLTDFMFEKILSQKFLQIPGSGVASIFINPSEINVLIKIFG